MLLCLYGEDPTKCLPSNKKPATSLKEIYEAGGLTTVLGSSRHKWGPSPYCFHCRVSLIVINAMQRQTTKGSPVWGNMVHLAWSTWWGRTEAGMTDACTDASHETDVPLARSRAAAPNCCFYPHAFSQKMITHCLLSVGDYQVCSYLLDAFYLKGTQLMYTWCAAAGVKRGMLVWLHLQALKWHRNKRIRMVQNKYHGFPLKWRFHSLHSLLALSPACIHIPIHTVPSWDGLWPANTTVEVLNCICTRC